MLGIFTFLRDAFERPSEKERRLLCARKRDDGRTPPPGGTGDGETGEHEDLLHMGDAERDEGIPPDVEVRDAVERIEHGEEGAETEEGMAEHRIARAETITAEELKKRAETLKDRMGDIVRWLDDDELKKQLDLLVKKKPEYATLIAALRQNKEVYKELLRELEPLLMETADLTDQPEDADVRFYAKTLATCLNKRWGDDMSSHGEKLRRASDLLKLFEDIVNPEWEYLAEIIPQLHGLHDDDPDAEEGRNVITLWTLWSLGLAGMKMWEAAEKARKEKQDREATTFAYNLAKRMGMEKWNPEMFFVLERDMFDAEDKAIRVVYEQAKGTDFDNLIPFEGGKLKIQIPKYRNIAILQAAAERGQIYQIDKAQQTVFGTPFESLVPETWLKNKARHNAEWNKLLQMNDTGSKKEKEEGNVEARRETKAIKVIDLIEEAVQEKRYWKIYGIIEWAVVSKVQMGEVGALIATRINRLLREDPDFARFASGPLLQDFGGIIQKGFPEASLLHLKLDHLALAQYGNRRALYDAAGGERTQREFARIGTVPPVIDIIERQLQHNDGRLKLDLSEACGVFTKEEIQLLGGTGRLQQYNEDRTIRGIVLDKAVAKVLSGQFVVTTEGKCISIWNDEHAEYGIYRNNLETTGGYRYSLSTREVGGEAVDPDHYALMNEGKLLAGDRLADYIFAMRGNSQALETPSHAENFLRSIAAFYYQLEKIVGKARSPEERGRREDMRTHFIEEQTRRLRLALRHLTENKATGTLQALQRLVLGGAAGEHKGKDLPIWLKNILEESIDRIRGRRP